MQPWYRVLAPYRTDGGALFGGEFIARWGAQTWAPCDEDRKAAAKLHMEINSRITSQRLSYRDGVEQTALDSVYALFQRTRDICTQHPLARHFDALAWHVLNTRVRPFTAKWHRASQAGALKALDATDEFRAELAALQPVLRCFDDLLLHVRDGVRPAPVQGAGQPGGIADEMSRPLKFRIPEHTSGGIDAGDREKLNAAEQDAIRERRQNYAISTPADENAVGLALSGGGIRSATFSLGVLIALAGRGLLPQFDYLSTVSGGGYLGSFLSAFLNSEHGDNIGLKPDQLPFKREGGEAAALRHLRHHSKYLATGSWWERITMLLAQLYGMVLNVLAVVLFAIALAGVEALVRRFVLPGTTGVPWGLLFTALLVLCAIGSLGLLRRGRSKWRLADQLIAVPALLLAAFLCWRGLDVLHAAVASVSATERGWLIIVTSAALLVVSALAGSGGRSIRPLRVLLVPLSMVAAPLFLLVIYLAAYTWAQGPDFTPWSGWNVPLGAVQLGVALLVAALYHFLLDVNATSPHRHYRAKLAEAYLIQAKAGSETDFHKAVPLQLSRLSANVAGQPARPHRAPYHLINCALNVPGSENSAMQGRLTDFFLFSPAFCGSPLLGYFPTADWEAKDRHLDLGTAMAISGAAAAPQMGLGTMTRLRFWLALLNVRLGYWLRKPGPRGDLSRPGLWYLLQEMLGIMNEKRPWVHVSDGGHIENLGIYELLRRRCKYIVAVDGEQDPQMTFQGLTRLQRLAAIDLGVRIDVDLDDLRLNDQGLSRSHFRFCRLRYPSDVRGSPEEYGYLLYLKLSLTGNEGEFIRRYRHDEPAFPHHTTADQFFSEEQFEAYRSLGEHAGNNLFLRAIVGEELAGRTDLPVDAWFRSLGENLLEPLPDAA